LYIRLYSLLNIIRIHSCSLSFADGERRYRKKNYILKCTKYLKIKKNHVFFVRGTDSNRGTVIRADSAPCVLSTLAAACTSKCFFLFFKMFRQNCNIFILPALIGFEFSFRMEYAQLKVETLKPNIGISRCQVPSSEARDARRRASDCSDSPRMSILAFPFSREEVGALLVF
jgi:hypothetical protein